MRPKWFVHHSAFLLLLILLSTPSWAVWVEYDPSTCRVGPPPICVAGHWFWQEESSAMVNHVSPGGRERHSHPQEMSADIEYESYSYADDTLEGNTVGVRMDYQRYLDSGLSYGLRGNFIRGTVQTDQGGDASSKQYTGTLYARMPLQGFDFQGVDVVGSGSIAHLTDAADQGFTNLIGTVAVAYEHWQGDALLTGAVGYRGNLSTKDIGGSGLDLGYVAVAAGSLPVGDKLAANGELYKLPNLAVIYGSLSFLASDVFALTVGYKTTLGIDDFSNNKIAIGANYRL